LVVILVKILACFTDVPLPFLAQVGAKYCLTGGQDRAVKLWNTASGKEIKEYKGHGYEVLGICVCVVTDSHLIFARRG
jgi:WD40 repeat protein